MSASRTRRLVHQLMATLSCMFAVMSAGNIIAWPSPATSKLQGPEFRPSNDELSWIVSTVFLGAGVGPLLFAFMTDHVGRKWINFFAAATYIVGWAICLVATNLLHIYIARVLHGIGISFTICIVPVYVGEVIEDHLRGAVTATIMMFTSLGALYVYIIGPQVSFIILNLVCLVFPVMTLLSFFLMPESPYFLVMNGRVREAESNLMRLRGESSKLDILSELEKIIEFIEDGFTRESFGTKLKIFQFKKSLKAVAIVTALAFTQHFSGFSVFKSYFEIIFSVSDSSIKPSTAVILAELVAFVVTLWSVFYIDKLGRRPVFLMSSIGCMVSTCLIGLYYILDYYKIVGTSYSWIAMIGIYGYQVFFHAGVSCMTAVVSSEIFPAFVRPWITAYTAMLLAVFGFCVTKFFQMVGDAIGYHFSFWILTILLIFPTFYLYVYMPETKNKSLIEIQRELSGKTSDVHSAEHTKKGFQRKI